MNSLAPSIHQHNLRATGLTCAVCARPVSWEAKTITGLGRVGSDCYQKYAALPKFLAKHGLEQYLQEQIIEAVLIGEDWMVPRWLIDLEAKVTPMGFIFVKKFYTKEKPYQISYRLEHRNTKKARAQLSNAYELWQHSLLAAS